LVGLNHFFALSVFDITLSLLFVTMYNSLFQQAVPEELPPFARYTGKITTKSVTVKTRKS
jgi:hypothetical protein